jgi:hypothetical protein
LEEALDLVFDRLLMMMMMAVHSGVSKLQKTNGGNTCRAPAMLRYVCAADKRTDKEEVTSVGAFKNL